MERVLLVFAKEPVPGRVKTRMAADMGEIAAARVYEEMGRRVVDQLRGGSYRTVVCFDPPDAALRVAAWLGSEGIEFLPQVPGDLGSRLETAFREAFRWGKKVVVVGTDAPDVDAEVVEEAFRRLGEADLVLGPAADGGYYLLGLRDVAPDLFRDVPWSSEKVLATTLERAEALGLKVALLPTLLDVDRVQDLIALQSGGTVDP
jgi:rSAM/selenodomain-associated transferase 1